jgi:osmotically-inducible protein OsmY
MTTEERKVISEFTGELDKEHGLDEKEIAAAQENSRVASAIRELLEREGHVPAHEAHVISRNGRVEISGEVSWLLRMPDAEKAILGVPGVSGLTNLLSVRSFESESDLKARIVDALVARAHSVGNRIAVERRNRRVTLSGTLSSPLYREVASEVAKGATGEGGVDDMLTVGFSTA